VVPPSSGGHEGTVGDGALVVAGVAEDGVDDVVDVVDELGREVDAALSESSPSLPQADANKTPSTSMNTDARRTERF
jgi:hypothetical protein